jgi:hypothetical protein
MGLYPEDDTMNNRHCEHHKYNNPFSINDELFCMVTFISHDVMPMMAKTLSCLQLVKHILIVFCIMKCQNKYKFLVNKRRKQK